MKAILLITFLMLGAAPQALASKKICLTGFGEEKVDNVVPFRPRSVETAPKVDVPVFSISNPRTLEERLAPQQTLDALGRLADYIREGKFSEFSHARLREKYLLWMKAVDHSNELKETWPTDPITLDYQVAIAEVRRLLDRVEFKAQLAKRNLIFGPELFYAPTKTPLPKSFFKQIRTAEILAEAHKDLKRQILTGARSPDAVYSAIQKALDHIEGWIAGARPYVGPKSTYETSPILKTASDVEEAYLNDEAFLNHLMEVSEGDRNGPGGQIRAAAGAVLKRIESLRTPLAFLRANGKLLSARH